MSETMSNRTIIFRHASWGGSLTTVAVELDSEWEKEAECAKPEYRTTRDDGTPNFDWDEAHYDDHPESLENARWVCKLRCPVQEKCLSHALEVREPAGMWGGMTEAERYHLLGIRKTAIKKRARKESGS